MNTKIIPKSTSHNIHTLIYSYLEDYYLDRMNQGDFQPLRGAQSQSDVLKEKFSLTATNIDDSKFRKSKNSLN